MPDLLADPSSNKIRPTSAPRARRREYAIGAPPYKSAYTGREVPARIDHDVARGKSQRETAAAVTGTTKNLRRARARPKSAKVHRRSGVVETVTPKFTSFSSPKAGVIVRRHASIRGGGGGGSGGGGRGGGGGGGGGDGGDGGARTRTTTKKLISPKRRPPSVPQEGRASVVQQHHDGLTRHASLGGPFTRSDPRMYGASVVTNNPSEAAIYSIPTKPSPLQLNSIEKGRASVKGTELTIPNRIRNPTEGHVIAAKFGDQLRGVKDRIPTPAPQSLDKVAPDLQKAILWPEHYVEREHWPKKKQVPGKISNDHGIKRPLTKQEYVSSLSRACRLNDVQVVRHLFIEEGTSWLNERDTKDGTTALHHAAGGGALDIVMELLLPNGADPTLEAEFVGTPLDVADQRLERLRHMSGNQKLKSLELEYQTLVCVLQTSTLWQASRDGDLPRVKHLLEFVHDSQHGGSVANNDQEEKEEEEEEMRPTHRPNDPNIYGMTALHYACMGGHAPIISYLLQDRGASTEKRNNLGQRPCDITDVQWIHDALNREKQLRYERRRDKEDRLQQVKVLQEEEEHRDRAAWSAARGTSSAVPLAKKLQQHQRNSMSMQQKRKMMMLLPLDDGGSEDNKSGGGGGAQKRGVFSGTTPTCQGRYLLARPGSAHTTKELAKKALPSDRIVDDRRTPMEGASRLRHVRRLSHGDDTPQAVYREFWRFDARKTSEEAKEKRRRDKRNLLMNKKMGKKLSTGSSSSSSSSSRGKKGQHSKKRMDAVSRRVTTTPNQGHPNIDSQAFNNWLRLHFGTNIPEARPMQRGGGGD